MKVIFKSPLLVQETEEGKWALTSPFFASLYVDAGTLPEHPSFRIVVPSGFVTDFCSVPRIPFAYLLTGGIGNRAGLLHDFLYSCESGAADSPMTRENADDFLREALAVCGVSWGKRFLMYSAVRLFGASYFKKEKQCPARAPLP